MKRKVTDPVRDEKRRYVDRSKLTWQEKRYDRRGIPEGAEAVSKWYVAPAILIAVIGLFVMAIMALYAFEIDPLERGVSQPHALNVVATHR